MGWLFGSEESSQEKNGAYNNIPPTPGISAWALGALPTILYGTPKVKQINDNDEIYSNFTNKLQTINSSTPKPGRARSLSAAVPETPIRTDKEPIPSGILKTPGTIGRNKNVAFAGLNSVSVDSLVNENQDAIIKSLEDRLATPIPNKTSSGRIKSGLPVNFPGKFPSPLTPKVVNIQSSPEEHTPLTQLTNKNTQENINNTRINIEIEPKVERDLKTDKIAPIEPSTPSFDSTQLNAPLSAIDINKIIKESRAVGQSNKEIAKTTDMIFSIVDRVGKLESSNTTIDELKQKVETAMDYAKEKDDEVTYYRARLAQVMEETTEITKKYNDEISKRATDSKTKGNIVNAQVQVNHEQQANDARIKELEEELRQFSELRKDYIKIVDENDKLSKSNRELREDAKRSSISPSTQATATASLETDLQRTKRQLAERESENKTLHSELAEIKRNIKTNNFTNQRLKDQIADLNYKLQVSESKLKSTEQTNDRLTKEIVELESASISSLKPSQSAEISRLRDDNRVLNNRLQLLSNDFEMKHLEAIQIKDKTIKSLEDRVENLQHQLKSNVVQHTDLDEHIQLLSNQLRAKKEELESLHKKYRDVEGSLMEFQTLKRANRQLSSKLEALELDCRKLKQSSYLSESRKLELSTENENLTRQVRQLQQGISTLGSRSKFSNPLALSAFGSDQSSIDSPKTTEHLNPSVPTFSIALPDSLQSATTNNNIINQSDDFSMKDASMPTMKEFSMKDVSYNSSRSTSSIITDPDRQRASELRLQQRQARIRSMNNSRMSISSN